MQNAYLKNHKMSNSIRYGKNAKIAKLLYQLGMEKIMHQQCPDLLKIELCMAGIEIAKTTVECRLCI